MKVVAIFVCVIGLISVVWIWMRWCDWILRSLIIVAVVVSAWRFSSLYVQATTPFFFVSLASSVYGEAQLYYDIGRGLNETDSSKATIRSKDRFQSYLFPLQKAPLLALRLDPFQTGGIMRIRETAIVNGLYHHLRKIELNQWNPLYQIRDYFIEYGELVLTVEDGAQDPQIFVTFASPLDLKLDRKRTLWANAFLWRVMVEWGVIVLVMLLLWIVIRKRGLFGSPPQGPNLLWYTIILMGSFFLMRVYMYGQWRETTSFVRSWLNGF